ncbi:MAG: cell envelope integrity protein TolA [Betaproteobacteria bacterium]|nr:MAG: cell envelope integrity protein TolA [Betaproteobacteria bacterium]
MNALPIDTVRWFAEEPEPKPVTSGVLTFGIHAAFAAMLVLSMNWQQRVESHASVKLWESLPTTKVKRTTPSKPKPAPPPPEVEPAPQPQKLQAEPAPPPAQPDIPPPPAATLPPPQADLAAPVREKVERPSPEPTNTVPVEPPPPVAVTPLEEQPAPQPEVDVEAMKRERALALAELLREEETTRLDDSLDREREARTAEQRQRLEERERNLARELSQIRTTTEQRRDEQQAEEEQEAAARALTDDYRARISARIRQRVILPPDLQGNPEAIYTVSLLPGGTVTEVRLMKTSGVATYDAAVERAIWAAQPLPVPEDPGLFQANFKNLRLNFRPKE